MLWYGSRWYDPVSGRWTQPDKNIPDPYHPLDWDHFSYVRNNPIRHTDPSGYCIPGINCPRYQEDIEMQKSTSLKIPPMTLDFPDCELLNCLNAGDNPFDILSSVIRGESGTDQSAANVLQVLYNRAYNIWMYPSTIFTWVNPSRTPLEELSSREFLDLLAFVATLPEEQGMAYPDPAFDALENSWPNDPNRKRIESALNYLLHHFNGQAPSTAPIIVGQAEPAFRDQRVIMYISGEGGPETLIDLDKNIVVWIDLVGSRSQYYYKPK